MINPLGRGRISRKERIARAAIGMPAVPRHCAWPPAAGYGDARVGDGAAGMGLLADAVTVGMSGGGAGPRAGRPPGRGRGGGRARSWRTGLRARPGRGKLQHQPPLFRGRPAWHPARV